MASFSPTTPSSFFTNVSSSSSSLCRKHRQYSPQSITSSSSSSFFFFFASLQNPHLISSSARFNVGFPHHPRPLKNHGRAKKLTPSSATTSTAVESESEAVGLDEEAVVPEDRHSLSIRLPPHLSHLSGLVAELSIHGADVASSLEPWRETLSFPEWNAIVSRFGESDWTLSWKLLEIFRKEVNVSDLIRARQRSGTIEEREATETNVENNLESFPDKLVQEAKLLAAKEDDEEEDSQNSQTKSESTTESELESSPDYVYDKDSLNLKLQRTLLKALLRNKKFEEVDKLLFVMKESGVERGDRFYYTLLDAYADSGRTLEAAQILKDMKKEGIEPRQFLYEKVAHVQMNQKNADLDLPKQIVKELMENGAQVSVAIFRNLLTAHWEARDTEGVEETLESMLVSGHTPILKDVLKVMQLHGRRGNYERILELIERMSEWNIEPNAGVYDYLIHAYCKAGIMTKAKETFLKFEELGIRPTPLSLNMLVDGYGKQRLHEEALETFESIRKNGYKTTTVSYSSIISAMALVEKFDKAEELYKRMVKQRVQPNLHTCITMIRCYTKRNFTRDGHKIYNFMKKAPFEMTEVAYGAALVLYTEGNWYQQAAALLQEIENKDIPLVASARGSLIESFSILENNSTSLAKVVEKSNLEVCKFLTSIFLSKCENHQMMTSEVISFLEKWKDVDTLEDTVIVYNACMNCLWKKGYKGLVRKILGMAREIYAGYTQPQFNETEWIIDVTNLSVGAAKAALFEWLNAVGESIERNELEVHDGSKVIIITGDEFTLHIARDNKFLKQVLSKTLEELGSPFVNSEEEGPKKLVAKAEDVVSWISQGATKEAMRLD